MIDYQQPREQRSEQQNKALHVFFEMLAQELNDHGMYVSQVIKADAPWNKERVKELIWKPTQKLMFDKLSTTELKRDKEISEIYDVVNRAIAEKGLHVDFPSYEQIKNEL